MQAGSPGQPEQFTAAEAYALRNRHPELFTELQAMANGRASHDELLMHAINKGLEGQEALALLTQIDGRPIELARATPGSGAGLPQRNTGSYVGTRSDPASRPAPALKVGGGSKLHGLIAIVIGVLLLFMGGGFSLITGGAFDDGGKFVYFPYVLAFGMLSLAGGIAMLFKK